MLQKYKVFIEEKVIYFTEEVISGILEIELFVPSNYSELFSKLRNVQQIVTSNPLVCMNSFFSKFKKIEAAGGIVVCDSELLFIKRNGLWDIPKGKMESNETPETTSIREIEEECGLNGEFTIEKKLIETLHTYEFKNKSVLKKTYWFLIDFIGEKSTKPQLEEGITDVAWLKKTGISQVKANTYSSIIDVLNAFENS
jgi:ADP-ribose pyrophosphatase YjhB (NUDIX family)